MKLRSLFVLALAGLFTINLTSCDLLDEPSEAPIIESTKKDDIEEKNPNRIFTHDEFMEALDKEKLTVEGYIQGKQIYDSKSNKASLYIQDDVAGYYIYGLPCSKDEYDNDLIVGQKIRVQGEKKIWNDLHEIVKPNYIKLDGSKIYDPVEVDSLDNDYLKSLCGTKVNINNLTVIKADEIDPSTDDFYYQVTDGTNVLTFCVESSLCLKGSEEYNNAISVKVGDVIDATGMMFVYEDAQLHTTKIIKSGVNVLNKSEGSLSYSEYLAAPANQVVTIEGFIQDKQIYVEDHTTLYLADENGAYYVYELKCTRDEYKNDLTLGQKIKVTGVRGNYKGMDEILGITENFTATFSVLDGKFRMPVKEITKEFKNDDLNKYSGQYVKFIGLTVSSKVSQIKGDLYYDVTFDKRKLTFCVESYLVGQGDENYINVKNLKIGDKITVEGYLYIWDNSPQLHTVICKKHN